MAGINDIVLIYMEDSPLTFARVEDIEADSKPGWFHIKLLMLQVPLQLVTWILRDTYIEGETFTMGGKEMRLEKVESPEVDDIPDESTAKDNPSQPAAGKAEVIALSDLKKK